jgi:hypothetical protein
MRSTPLIVNDNDHHADRKKHRHIIHGNREDIVKDATIIVHGPWEDQTTDKRIREQQ